MNLDQVITSESIPRRSFMGRVLGGVAAAAVLPALTAPLEGAALRPSAPPRRLLRLVGRDDETSWKLVRDQFPIRPGFIYLNAANLAPSPYVVSDAVADLTRDIDREMSQQNRAKFSELREQARIGLAQYLGADPEEIAISRNTTEGNNTIVNGLTLGRGDEVVIW